MKKLFLPVIALALVLGGCASMGGGTAKSRLETHKLDAMDGKKEVYIGSLGVTFVTEDSSSSKATSPMIRHGASDYAKAHLRAKLSGVPEATMQAITDQVYADLVSKLQAQGYTVRNYADLSKNKRWNKIDKLESPYLPTGMSAFRGGLNKDWPTYSPTGMDLIYAQKIANTFAIGEVADEIGVPVLAANYTVHFAYFDDDADYKVEYGKGALGQDRRTLSASVALGQGIQVTSGSGLYFANEGAGSFADNGYIRLKDPIIVAGAYGENEDTTSGATKAVNAFSSLLGMVSGRSSSTTEITVNAVPEYYQEGALKVLTAANERIVNKLNTEK
ncbi:hypothetical protein [Thalassolituus sp.]|uniref:hypothetical protein n=1 Tax=Thalassolituus sp. TaxID=2030822 RepID=UPI0035181ADB